METYQPTLRELLGDEQFEYLCAVQHERDTVEELESLYRKNRCPIHGNNYLDYRHRDGTLIQKPLKYKGAYEINSLCEVYCDMCESPKAYPWNCRIIARVRGWHQKRWLESRTDDEIVPEGRLEKMSKKIDDYMLEIAEGINQMVYRIRRKRKRRG